MIRREQVVNSAGRSHAEVPVAMTVAGFDPSSGAGATADLRVFGAHGVYGVSVLTALTVQSTLGVRRVEGMSPRRVREMLECLSEDVQIAGVKIGMLGTAGVARALAAFLRKTGIQRERIVLDPVIRSSSGRELLSAEGLEVMREDLLPVVGWVTPNVEEMGMLVGRPPARREDVPRLVRELAARAKYQVGSGLNVVVTGGHLETPDDYLLTADGEEHWFSGKRMETQSTHGTGCVFSSALLCRLMAGDGPAEAVAGAKDFVRRAMERAVQIGRGKGPVLTDCGGPAGEEI